jgi:hypothetical protein
VVSGTLALHNACDSFLVLLVESDWANGALLQPQSPQKQALAKLLIRQDLGGHHIALISKTWRSVSTADHPVIPISHGRAPRLARNVLQGLKRNDCDPYASGSAGKGKCNRLCRTPGLVKPSTRVPCAPVSRHQLSTWTVSLNSLATTTRLTKECNRL